MRKGPDREQNGFWYWSPYDFEYAEQPTKKSLLLLFLRRRRCAVRLER